MSVFSDNPYYHETIVKLVEAFGYIFSGMQIIRTDDSGEKDQVISVPIEYAPKNKWISILNEDPKKQKNLKITLPRLAFEITGYQYDRSRKIGTQGAFLTGTIGEGRSKLFNPVPYDINITLYSLCKNQFDSLQILEQILPYFSPSMTVNLEILPQYGIKKDIPIVLKNVSVNDSYEGLSTDFRLVQQEFTFVAQVDLFGPIIQSKKIIKHTVVDVSTTEDMTGQIQNLQDVVPDTANKNDTYTITETWGMI